MHGLTTIWNGTQFEYYPSSIFLVEFDKHKFKSEGTLSVICYVKRIFAWVSDPLIEFIKKNVE